MRKHSPIPSVNCHALTWRASLHRLRASAISLASLSALAFGGAIVPRVQAANDAWSTSPTDGTFTGMNWTTGTTTPGARTGTVASGDSLYFGTSSITTLNENEAVGFIFAGFTFNAGASAFTIGGNSFALGTGGITNNSTSLQTINDAFTMAATDTFTTTAGGGNLALGGAISGAGGMTFGGMGTTTLSGALSYTGATTVNTGTLNLTGTGTINAISVAPAGSAVLNLASTGTLNIGNNDYLIGVTSLTANNNAITSNGVVNQTTGTVAQGTGNQLVLASGSTSAFAGYNLSGGKLAVGTVRAGGVGNAAEGNSLFTQTGGTFTSTNYFIGRNSSGMNQVYINGAGASFTASTALTIGYVGSGTAVATVSAGSLTTTGSLYLGNTSNGNFTGTAILNLDGGLVSAPSFTHQGTNTAIVNFNGGTLQASGASTAYLTGMTSANVYSGGAKIDTNGQAITIAQPLLTTGGTTGVTTIPIFNGGSGYLSAPLVSITGGSGTGATAVANLTGGVVTSITITSPGTGYGTTAPTVSLIGGGATTAATFGTTSGSATITAGTGANAATDGGLTKIGTGTLTLTGTNTYNGGTTISAGNLQFGSAAAIPTSGQITINSAGALNDAGAYTTVTAYLNSGKIAAGSTGSIALMGNSAENINFAGYNNLMLGAAAASTYTGTITPGTNGYFLGGGGATLTLSGAATLTGANALTVGATGSTGTVVLSGTNSYTGGTTINGGTLQFAQTSALPATGTVTVNSGTTLAVNAGGTGEFTNGTTGAGTIGGLLASATFNGAAAFGIDTTNASGTFAYAGNITNAGLGLTKLGTGTLNLSGANTYTGPTTVNAGTLQAGVASVAGTSGAFGNNSAVTLANVAGATLDLNGFNTQVGSLTGGGTTGGNVTLGSATMTLAGTNTSAVAYSGIISGTGSVTKIGAGTETFSYYNTYSGGTTVSGGTLALNAGGSAGTVQGAVTITSGATLNLTNTNALGTNSGSQVTVLNINGGTVNNTTTGVEGMLTSFNLTGGTLSSTGSGVYNINPAGTGAPGITSNASGTTSTISGGIDINGGGNLGIAVASGSTGNNIDLQISGVISDTGALTKTGSGYLNLTGQNTFMGNVTVSGGTLNVGIGGTGTASALGADSTTKAITVSSGATLSGTINNWFGTGTQNNGSGVSTLPTITLNGGTLSTTRYTAIGALNLNGGTVTATSSDMNATFQAFALTGDVTVGGTTSSTITSTNVGVGPNAGGYHLGNNAGKNTTLTVAPTGGTGVDLTVSAPLINQSGDFGGGAAGFTKAGAGVMALTATNTYTGATIVNAGTLLVTGSTATGSAVTVNNSGTMLSGTGTVGGPVTVGSGATILAGNNIQSVTGKLTTGALTLNTGSIFNALLASNTSFSTLSAAGTTTLGNAAFSITTTPGATFTNGQVLDLITSQVSGAFTNTTFTAGGYNFTADYTTNMGNFDVDISAVPEPATWLAGFLLLGTFGVSQRRKLAGWLNLSPA